MRIYVQTELTRGLPMPNLDGIDVTLFNAPSWRDIFADIEAGDTPAHLFCSLQIARRAQHTGGRVAAAVSLPDLRSHKQMARLGDRSLNATGVFLPLSHLPAQWPTLQQMMGEDLFLRPDSSDKVFAGRPVLKDLARIELNSILQVDRAPEDTLCQISPLRSFSLPEYRCWMIEEEMVTWAPYAFETDAQADTLPDGIEDLAVSVARDVIDWDHMIVVDCVTDDTNTPKVMEMNGFSTSGFYPGMTLTDLFHRVKSCYVF